MDFKTEELIKIIDKGETLKVEFKSDLKLLPDRDLVATAISLANTEGGLIVPKGKGKGTIYVHRT